jgi:hypothetical protein
VFLAIKVSYVWYEFCSSSVGLSAERGLAGIQMLYPNCEQKAGGGTTNEVRNRLGCPSTKRYKERL